MSDLGRHQLFKTELTGYSFCQLSSFSCRIMNGDVFVSLLKASAMSVYNNPTRRTTAGVKVRMESAVKKKKKKKSSRHCIVRPTDGERTPTHPEKKKKKK